MAIASVSSRSQTTSSSSSSSSSRSCSSPFASSSAANFSSPASPLNARSYDLNLHRSPSPPSPSSSVRFSVEKRRSMSVTKTQRSNNGAVSSKQKRTCMCSPTTHPGSFRCAYHKRLAEQKQQQKEQNQTASFHSASPSPSSSNSNKLNLRRSAMKNSLVRIGGVEGEIVRRALTTLIRPSSHHQRRREAFQPRPSRLSIMSKAQDSELVVQSQES